MRFRHQLAAYSPIRAASIAAAISPASRSGAVDELRRHLRDAYRASDVALVDSGTHALQLALEVALRARSGGIVAIPGFTCFDVATAVVGSGARVILYDVDPATLQPDFESLESAFRAGASIAVIAPLYGMPIAWDEIRSAAAAHDVLVIEDAAQGHGATWKGQPLGSLGDLSVLSFSRGKGWTGGYGGALLARGAVPIPVVASEALDAKGVAALAAQWMLGRPSLYGLPRSLPGLNLGETVYHPPTPVHGMSESAASALLSNRAASLREAEHRRSIAKRLLAVSRAEGPRGIATPRDSDPGYLRFPFRSANGFSGLGDPTRASRLGIAPSYPMPLADLVALRGQVARQAATPGSTELARTLITAPTHSLLSASDREAIEEFLAMESARAAYPGTLPSLEPG